MLVERSGILFHYQVKGSGKIPVLLLHGWGRDASYWQRLVVDLENRDLNFRFYLVDMPGFGISAPPPKIWGARDYADFLSAWMRDEAPQENWIVIGHSFGGKVALFLARIYQRISSLILLASAGVVARRTWPIRIKIAGMRCLKKLLSVVAPAELVDRILEIYRMRHGSIDYQMARGVMRAVLVRTLSEDVTAWLPEIRVPALLIWGREDSATPISGAQVMQRLLPQAQLKIIEKVGHDLLSACPDRVLELIKENLQATLLKIDLEGVAN